MRKTILFIGLLSLMIPVAAKDAVAHYVTTGVFVGAAWEHPQTDRTNGKPLWGTHDGLALGYALQYNRLLFHAGLEASFRYLEGNLPDYDDSYPAVDSQDDPFTMLLHYSDVRRYTRGVKLALPLRIGGQWQNFYFLLGPALTMTFANADRQRANVTAMADYGVFCVPFSDMPNHGLTTEFIDPAWAAAPACWAVDAAAELGFIIAGSWRLGLYADVNLWRNTPYRIADTYDAGLRLTYWFRFPQHYPCRCLIM